MIQRRQSLYLLIIALSAFMLLRLDPVYFTELGQVKEEVQEGLIQKVEVSYTETRTNEENIGSNRGIAVLLWLHVGIALLSIFLFKKRKLQLTVVRVLMLASLLLFANMYWYSLGMDYTLHSATKSFSPAALSPLAMLLFNFLAQRGIAHDERLVKSLDRLR